MYIFLDESYNLKDRNKPQIITINGFITTDVKVLWKKWRRYRKGFLSKTRIHASDRRFEKLRNKSLKLIKEASDIKLLSVIQNVQYIPVDSYCRYYTKHGLSFEKVYIDMLKFLFIILDLQHYRQVIITIDSRKPKGGFIGKQKFKEDILSFLKKRYVNTKFFLRIIPSSSNILIELADFVSNSFFKEYIQDNIVLLEDLMYKTIIIKNPLGKPRG